MKDKTLNELLANPHFRYYTIFGLRFQRYLFLLAVFYTVFSAVMFIWLKPWWVVIYGPMSIGLYVVSWWTRRQCEKINPNLIPKDPP